MSSIPAKPQQEPQSESRPAMNLSAKRGSRIDTRDLDEARKIASALKIEVKSVKQIEALVGVTLPVDVIVATPHQIFMRFLANPNVPVVCDPMHPIIIPKGSKVQMDGRTLRVTDTTEVRGCMIRMNGKDIRFKDAPCHASPNQQFFFIEALSTLNLPIDHQSLATRKEELLSEASMQMVITDADIQHNTPAPSGKIIGEKPQNNEFAKAA